MPKSFPCVPIESNSSPAYDLTCDVWFTNGVFAGACDCAAGLTLVDPSNSLLTIQDGYSTGAGRKASGSHQIPQAAGTRTLCVRTCDGYYFPISASATRKRFKIDEAVCKAMYGGADANLFLHDNGAPADTAVSLKGKPLAREPYAFAFRNSFSETCQAKLKTGLTRLGSALVAKAAKASPAPAPMGDGAPMPYPAPRLIAGTDPETLTNRTGSFLVASVLSPDEAAIVAAASMRKVGAAYYYDDPTVIDTLRDPPPRGPEFTLIGSALADQPGSKPDIRAPGFKTSTTSLSPGQF